MSRHAAPAVQRGRTAVAQVLRALLAANVSHRILALAASSKRPWWLQQAPTRQSQRPVWMSSRDLMAAYGPCGPGPLCIASWARERRGRRPMPCTPALFAMLSETVGEGSLVPSSKAVEMASQPAAAL